MGLLGRRLGSTGVATEAISQVKDGASAGAPPGRGRRERGLGSKGVHDGQPNRRYARSAGISRCRADVFSHVEVVNGRVRMKYGRSDRPDRGLGYALRQGPQGLSPGRPPWCAPPTIRRSYPFAPFAAFSMISATAFGFET